MNAAATHPTLETLTGFLHGRLAADARLAVERHVEACAACCQTLESLPVDTLGEQVRGIDTPGTDTAGIEMPGGAALRRPAAQTPPELTNHSRYRVIRPLGAGGMGAVFLAEHRRMERMVALKVIHPELLNHATTLERFEREVKSAARLAHPNIVAAHDADAAGDVHFLVMEYVEGASLARVVEKKGPLPVTHACHYIRQAAIGLQHAHDKGMIHRDIKPQNLMLTKKGQIKIVDFGLACLTRIADVPHDGATPAAAPVAGGLTLAGTVVGTPDYMAPEQIDGAGDIDIRADLYALGCTLYFLLAGRPPFRGATANQTLDNNRLGRRTPIVELNPDVPAELAKVIDRMLQRRPADRYQTPADVAAALAPFAKAAPKDDLPPPTIARPRPARRMALALGAAVLLAALGLGLLANRWPKSAPPVVAPAAVKQPVLVVVPQEFEAAELRATLAALQEAKIPAAIASSALTPCRSLKGEPTAITPELAFPESGLAARDYAGVVLIGGYVHAFKDDRPARQALWDLLKGMNAARKPIAAAESSLVVLSVAGQLQGKHVARSGRVQQYDQIRPSGALWTDRPIAVDGQLFTAANADALAELMPQFVRRLEQ